MERSLKKTWLVFFSARIRRCQLSTLHYIVHCEWKVCFAVFFFSFHVYSFYFMFCLSVHSAANLSCVRALSLFPSWCAGSLSFSTKSARWLVCLFIHFRHFFFHYYFTHLYFLQALLWLLSRATRQKTQLKRRLALSRWVVLQAGEKKTNN